MARTKLYEINDEIYDIILNGYSEDAVNYEDYVDEDGVVDTIGYEKAIKEQEENSLKRLKELEVAREIKLENIGLLIKQFKADFEAIKAEKIKLEKRQSAYKNKYENLTNWLDIEMKRFGDKLFETPRIKLSYRKSETVEIAENVDINKLDEEYVKTTKEFKKKELKRALDAGIKFDGIILQENQNLQIK